MRRAREESESKRGEQERRARAREESIATWATAGKSTTDRKFCSIADTCATKEMKCSESRQVWIISLVRPATQLSSVNERHDKRDRSAIGALGKRSHRQSTDKPLLRTHHRGVLAGTGRVRDQIVVLKTAGKGVVWATKAVETQGKGGVLAAERQWKHKAKAVS